MADAIVLAPGEGEITADTPRRTTRIKAGVDAVTVTEMRHEAGMPGPGVHIHRRHTDAFYVLEGELALELGAFVSTSVVVSVPAGAASRLPALSTATV